MIAQKVVRKLAALAALSLLIVGPIACGDDPTDEDDDPADRIQTVRLQIGTQTFNLVGAQPPATPIVLALGTHTVTATALDGSGQTINLPASEFELGFEIASTTRLTYTETGPFTGTFNALTAGQTTMIMFYFHLEEQHRDYEVPNIVVTIQ